MSARTVTSIFTNKTDATLVRTSVDLIHGGWVVLPPDEIKPGATHVTWISEEIGLATGVEARLTYAMKKDSDEQGTLVLYWKDPYVGSNEYTQNTTDGWKISRQGGTGNDPTVVYLFEEA